MLLTNPNESHLDSTVAWSITPAERLTGGVEDRLIFGMADFGFLPCLNPSSTSMLVTKMFGGSKPFSCFSDGGTTLGVGAMVSHVDAVV
jgi:hypothetical protein